MITPVVALFAGAMISCGSADEQYKSHLDGEQGLIFFKDEKITNDNFTGTAWLTSLVTAGSTNANAVGSVTFAPGARTNWNLHPAGQIILATGGERFYQEKGHSKRIL